MVLVFGTSSLPRPSRYQKGQQLGPARLLVLFSITNSDHSHPLVLLTCASARFHLMLRLHFRSRQNVITLLEFYELTEMRPLLSVKLGSFSVAILEFASLRWRTVEPYSAMSSL